MRNSHLIWIPSLQTNVRFLEITNAQYRAILKNLDDDTLLDFLYTINTIITENLIEPINSNNFTIVDRFIIMMYLKILCYGPFLKLSKECDICGKTININIDLNSLLDEIAPKLDKPFGKTITSINNPFEIICDLPTIHQEYIDLLYHHNKNTLKNLDNEIDGLFTSFIRDIKISGTSLNLDTLAVEQRNEVIPQLPANLLLNIRNNFIEPLYKDFNDVIFLDLKCDSCKTNDAIKMETRNLIFLLKLFFKDNDLGGVLKDYLNLTSVGRMNESFLDIITPKELSIFTEYVMSSQKQSNPIPQQHNDIDLFANELDGKPRSDSEFSGF